MKSCSVLPENYIQRTVIDLEKDKKAFWFVNILSLVIAALMVAIGVWAVPLDLEPDADNFVLELLLPLIVLLAGIFAYIVLHEAVHGVFMYAFSRVRPRFGFKLVFAYAGSEAYFDKIRYIVIALAPVVFWGMVLLIIDLFCKGIWFWVFYIIQVCNVGGAAGDFYVTAKILRMPKDILIQDTGTQMTVFAPVQEKQEEGS